MILKAEQYSSAFLFGKNKLIKDSEVFVRKAKRLLDKIPFDKLPDTIRDAFKSLKQKVDDFVLQMKKADNPADNIKTADNVTDAAKNMDTVKNTKSAETAPKQPDVEPPKKPDIQSQKHKNIDKDFEEIDSIQNFKNIDGVTIKKIDQTSLKELENIKSEFGIDKFSNVAKADVSINKPLDKTEFVSYSGFDKFKSKIPDGSISPRQETKIFDTFDAPTTKGTTLKRHNDAEVKILEDLASQLGVKKGDVGTKVFSDVKGNITLKTELCPCGSCSKVIEQFNKLFPNVNVEILAQPKTSF